MEKVPEGFELTAHSKACPNVAIADVKRGFYGVQYHPEVDHTENGVRMIRNFLYEVCGARGDWTMEDYRRSAVEAVRKKVGGGRVLLALSGGVDSSVCAQTKYFFIWFVHIMKKLVDEKSVFFIYKLLCKIKSYICGIFGDFLVRINFLPFTKCIICIFCNGKQPCTNILCPKIGRAHV